MPNASHDADSGRVRQHRPVGWWILEHRWRVFALAIGSAILGVTAAELLPKYWEAVALIQIGEVGQPAATGVDGQMIEAPARVAQRLKDQKFIDQALKDVTAKGGASVTPRDIAVGLPRETNLVELRVSSSDSETARLVAQTLIARLSAVHAALSEPTIARYKAELILLESALLALTKERNELTTLVEGAKRRGADVRFSDRALLASLVAAHDEKAYKLKELKLRIEEQLSVARTFPTGAFSDIRLVETRTGRLFLGALGFALGTVLGLLWSWRTSGGSARNSE